MIPGKVLGINLMKFARRLRPNSRRGKRLGNPKAKIINIYQEDVDRFFSKIRLNRDECWLWGRPSYSGYGGFATLDGKIIRAHRWAYAWLTGENINDKMICHLCPNSACVNPLHVYAGTAKDNAIDAVVSGTHGAVRKTHCKHGHKFDAENTVMKYGWRHCRKCKNTALLKLYHRKKRESRQLENDL